MPSPLVNLLEAEERAEATLDPATFAFVAAGAGEERTLAANREAFRRHSLVPRALSGVAAVDTTVELLGTDLSMPVLVAPMGLQRIAHPEGECATARAAATAGTLMCVSTVSTRSPAEIAATGVAAWYQLYLFKDRAINADLIAQAVAGGYRALVLTVDGPVIGKRDRAIQSGFSFGPEITIPSCGPALGLADGPAPDVLATMMEPSLTWDTLEWLAAESGVPVVVKGVLSAADARLACEHGAAAVIVSNHGGRQLDGSPAALDALASVVEAVDGRVPVLVDGGVRRGIDVLIALALGARAVLVGRPVYWGLAFGGEQGVAAVLECLRAELAQDLMLLGCRTPAEVDRSYLAQAGAEV